jgi:hypothetical protein
MPLRLAGPFTLEGVINFAMTAAAGALSIARSATIGAAVPRFTKSLEWGIEGPHGPELLTAFWIGISVNKMKPRGSSLAVMRIWAYPT